MNNNRNQNGDPRVLLEKWKRYTSDLERPKSERSTLLESKTALDGKTYGVFLEDNKYFIKVANTQSDNLVSEDFNYIGGIENKMIEKYDSIQQALKRMNFKMYSINEAAEFGLKENEQEDALFNKLEKVKKDEPATDVPANDVPVGVEEPAPEAPVADTPAEDPALDAPVADAPAEEPVLDEPAGDESAEDELDAIESQLDNADEPAEEPVLDEPADDAPADDAPAEDNSEEENPDDDRRYNDILSELGRLGAEIDKTSVTGQLAKNILNTIITKTKDGIADMSEHDKDTIAKRIAKNGEKLDEEEDTVEGSEVLDATLNESKLDSLIEMLVEQRLRK
jgi:hypothetical protein